jgi:hypothetical protein
VELAGKPISVTIDDTCVLTFWGLVMGTQPSTPTPREVAKVLNDLAVEASEIRDRIEELIEEQKVPVLPSVVIYEAIEASDGHEARSRAVAVHNTEHPDEVLIVTSTIPDNTLGVPSYKILGYTKPREKATRKKAAVEEAPK